MDEIRQPDEAIYETLNPSFANANRRRRIRLPKRQNQRPMQGQPQEQIQNQYQYQQFDEYQQFDDPEFDAAIQASLLDYSEQISIAESEDAELERNCMSVSDAESLASTNLDRHLSVAKTQCMKLGRFDADYLTALKWIRTGLCSAIDGRVLNKLKQVRLPAAELDIICKYII
jgi:hypothetical protein